jgi:hypothetical protein
MLTIPVSHSNSSIERVEVSTSSSEYYGLTFAESLGLPLSKASMIPCVIASIFIATIGIFGYILSLRQNVIEDQSSSLAALIYDEVGSIVAIGTSLSVAFTSSTKHMTWPLVGVPDFGEQSSVPLKMDYIRQVIFSPFLFCDHELNLDNQLHTESYNGTDQNLVLDDDVCSVHAKEITQDEARQLMFTKMCLSNENSYLKLNNSRNFVLSPIWQTYSREEGTRWKISPSLACDSNLKRAVEDMIVAKRTVVTGSIYLSRPETPQSFVLVPLYRNFSTTQVIGSVFLKINWRALIQKVVTKYYMKHMIRISVTSNHGQNLAFKSSCNGNVTLDGSQSSGHDGMSKKDPSSNATSQGIRKNMNDTSTMRSWENDLWIACNQRPQQKITSMEILFAVLIVSGILSLFYSVFIIYELGLKRGMFATVDRDSSFMSDLCFSLDNREFAVSMLSFDLVVCQNQERRSLKKDWLNQFLSSNMANQESFTGNGEPIADLFPSTTVVSTRQQ